MISEAGGKMGMYLFNMLPGTTGSSGRGMEQWLLTIGGAQAMCTADWDYICASRDDSGLALEAIRICPPLAMTMDP